MKAQAMIMPKKYFFDKDGNPLAFGKVYTYQAGTTINKETYTTENGDVANTNPVILNGEGYATIYIDGSYNIVVNDLNDNNIWTEDPVSSSIAEEWISCESASYLTVKSFVVSGNVTEEFTVGRAVRIDNGVANYSYSSIVSSSFAGGETAIVISDELIQVGIVGVCLSVVSDNSSPSHNSTKDRNAVSAHDQIYRRTTTISEIESGVFVTGDKLTVSDRLNATFDVVAGDYDGIGKINAGDGNVAELAITDNVNILFLGAIADWNGSSGTDNSEIIQYAFDNYTNVIIPKLSTRFRTVAQLELRTGIRVKGGGLLKHDVSGVATACINGFQISDFKVQDLDIEGSQSQDGTDPQDGDKGIFLNGCTDGKIQRVKTRKTWAWGIIQAGACEDVDFKELDCGEADNQSCISIANGSKNANVTNCRADTSGLYGLEIELNVTDVNVVGMRSRKCAAGINILDSKNISIVNSFLRDNDSPTLSPPNASNDGGWGLRMSRSDNIVFTNGAISGSVRAPVEILGCKGVTISNNDLQAYETTVQQNGVVFVAENGAVLSSDVEISNNRINCHGQTYAIQQTQLPFCSGAIVGNKIANPNEVLMRVRTDDTFTGNRFITAIPTIAPSAEFLLGEVADGAFELNDFRDGTTNPQVTFVCSTDLVIAGYYVEYEPVTVTGSPQWVLKIDGVDTVLGTAGIPGKPTRAFKSQMITYSAGDTVQYDLVSTTGDTSRILKVGLYFIPIVPE